VQRLAVARLLLEQPPLAILDEATSAVGAEVTADLYGAIRSAGIAVLTLGQRDSPVRAQHDAVVSLVADGGGGWAWLPPAASEHRQPVDHAISRGNLPGLYCNRAGGTARLLQGSTQQPSRTFCDLR